MIDQIDSRDNESLLEFPCQFPIKMMGNNCENFRSIAIEIVQKHTGTISADAIKIAPSRNGTYVSLTITIVAQDQQQLDNIYRDLSNHDDVLVAL